MNILLNTPILLIIFNRPDLTEKIFSRIRDVKPRQLFIAADGPRSERSGEEILCQETRKVVQKIDWHCEVHHLYRDQNLGCKIAVSAAITWFFKHVDRGIILEDDCLPESSFFQFCEQLLEYYNNNNRIGMISGNNFQSIKSIKNANYSYYMSKYPHIWGWATWRRVWKDYDVNLESWSGELEAYKDFLPNAKVRLTFTQWMNDAKTGKINTWDYQFLNLMITQRLLAITPWVNLVANIGFDERATHTTGDGKNLPSSSPIQFPLKHPEELSDDAIADRYSEEYVFNIITNYASYLRVKFVKILGKLKFLKAIF